MVNVARELKEALSRSGRSLCVAESVTAGHLQSMVASVSGASEHFEGGVTAYNLRQKVRWLGVDRGHAAEVDCVSARVARQMAGGARIMFGADVGVATTGYAEPSPDKGVEQPQAYFAIDVEGRVTEGRIEAAGLDRVAAQRYIAETVLRRLVEVLRREA